MIRVLAAALLLLLPAVPAHGQPPTKEVVVLTSFPKELFEAYKQAFERKTPGVRVVVKQQQTFAMKLGGVDFDDKLSSSRRNVVNSLFDHAITFRHAELKAAWAAIQAAELAEARRLASTVPLDARRASDREVNAAFKDRPDVKSRMETEWDTAAKGGYARARELAEAAAAKLR